MARLTTLRAAGLAPQAMDEAASPPSGEMEG